MPATESAHVSLRRAVRLAIAALALVPIGLARYPPLYDYYHWTFQGYLVASLLPGSPVARPELAALYHLHYTPIPNLAAPLGIGLLATVFSPATAGRLFVVLCVLAFGAAFAWLVRAIQGRPSALEFLALPWAYGLLTYKGYISSLGGVALAFLAIAWLHRAVADDVTELRRRDGIVLGAAGVACYLLHMVGWLVFAAAIAVHAVWLRRRGRTRDGWLVLANLLPVMPLLGWYVWLSLGHPHGGFYTEISDKLLSLGEGFLLFLRTDPLPPPFPLFWANVVGLAGLAGVVLANLDRSRPTAWPIVNTGLLLVAVAVLLPLSDVGGLGRPDERLALPGLLLAVAGLRHRAYGTLRCLFAAGVITAILGAHAFEYARASRQLERIETAIEAAVPPDSDLASVTVWRSRTEGGCADEAFPSIGVPSLKWFGLERVIASGGPGSRLMETSVVHSSRARHDAFPLLVELMAPDAQVPELAARYAAVQFFGCPEDIREAAATLPPDFHVVADGAGFAVLTRHARPEPTPR